jgi:hypothetical protein
MLGLDHDSYPQRLQCAAESFGNLLSKTLQDLKTPRLPPLIGDKSVKAEVQNAWNAW